MSVSRCNRPIGKIRIRAFKFRIGIRPKPIDPDPTKTQGSGSATLVVQASHAKGINCRNLIETTGPATLPHSIVFIGKVADPAGVDPDPNPTFKKKQFRSDRQKNRIRLSKNNPDTITTFKKSSITLFVIYFDII